MGIGKRTAIVIGAGIVGLAHALELSKRGYAVQIFERGGKATGASVRNFGMVWPIGQPSGLLYNRAMRSRQVWKEMCTAAGLWYSESGSLHVANTVLEATVLQELTGIYEKERGVKWLNKQEALAASSAINPAQLQGAFWSPSELIVESRVAIEKIPHLLVEKYGVKIHYNTAISRIEKHIVYSGDSNWQADLILVCSGADFETLFPELFSALAITKCKLQIMRMVSQPNKWTLVQLLCGGLSLIHYKSFEAAPSLPILRGYFEHHLPQYVQWGIHVMACQNGAGEITVGDTHEYGLDLDPFDKQFLNNWIVDYLKSFCVLPSYEIIQTWNGSYAKMKNGQTEWVYQAGDNIWLVNGMGGAGMTLSFGLAQEVLERCGA